MYGVEVEAFLCSGVWVFWWFHDVGIRVGNFGELGVEVIGCYGLGLEVGLSYGSFGGFRVAV